MKAVGQDSSVIKNLAIGFIRWVAVAVAVRLLYIPPNDVSDPLLRSMVIALLVYNLLLTIPGKSMRFRMTNFFTVILDTAFIASFAYFSPLHGHYWLLLFLLPVLYSALDYGTDGGSMAAVVVSIGHGASGLIEKFSIKDLPTLNELLPEIGPIVGFFIVYLFFGMVVGQLSIMLEKEKQVGEKMHGVTEQLGATIRFLGVAGDKAQASAKQLAAAINLIGTTAYSGVSTRSGMDSIFDQLIKGAVEVLRADRGMIMLIDDSRKKLYLKSSWGRSSDKLPADIDVGEDISGWVAENGQGLIITKNNYPENLVDAFNVRDIKDSLVVPITIDGKVTGVLALENKLKGTFDPEDMNVMETVAKEAGMVIVNADLYKETMDKKKALEKMIKEVQTAQEKERRRIARDLHDGMAQELAKISLDLGILRISSLKKKERNEEIERLETHVQESIDGLRSLIYDLRPASLDSFGLVPTLEQYIKKFSAETDILVEQSFDIGTRLPEEYEINIFRIVQEALNNILKYAMTKKAAIAVESSSSEVVVEISDKGSGFNPDEVDLIDGTDHNFGILGMKERVESLGGSFLIESEKGEGTKIRIVIPAATRDGVLIETG